MHRAVVVGSGPNGLVGAIRLAEAGYRVRVVEGQNTIGGGARSAELTLPGFTHDICAGVFPFAPVSPAFRHLPLAEHGFTLIDPPTPLAHPLDDGTAVTLERSVSQTARGLDPEDAAAYERLIGPLVRDALPILAYATGGNLLRPGRHLLAILQFALLALRPTAGLAKQRFRGERARALLAGLGCHALLPVEERPGASYALVLAILGHWAGYPIARGGSQRLSDALASILTTRGGTIETGRWIEDLDEVAQADVALLEVAPRGLLQVAGDRLSGRYRRDLACFRHGPGVFKVDWALDGPVPWSAEACRRAGTLHLGGSFEEIAAAERDVHEGRHPERPFTVAIQQSLFDPSLAPVGKHTFYAYCHVPNGSTADMTAQIEAQVERFAPGFRERIIARATSTPAELEAFDPTLVGGDILGGRNHLRQLLARPTLRRIPYSTPIPGVYLCSSSTPPGGGVHGMCGALAAETAIRLQGVPQTERAAAPAAVA